MVAIRMHFSQTPLPPETCYWLSSSSSRGQWKIIQRKTMSPSFTSISPQSDGWNMLKPYKYVMGFCPSINSGWWLTYPSEKYESQLGRIIPYIMETQTMFETTNQRFTYLNFNFCLMLDSTPTYHHPAVPSSRSRWTGAINCCMHRRACCIDGACPSSTHHWCGHLRGRSQLTSSRPWWKMEPGALWMGKNLRVLPLFPTYWGEYHLASKMMYLHTKSGNLHVEHAILNHIHWQNWSYISPNFLGDGCPCCKSSCGWSGAGRGGSSSVDTASSCHSAVHDSIIESFQIDAKDIVR